ncbi:MAG: SPOR domain-containing protein [Vicinamibacterales bacterium]|jgi:cell division protein FtsN|nr:SPOR domain-containing protein [Vicinamibacterales bacterium]
MAGARRRRRRRGAGRGWLVVGVVLVAGLGAAGWYWWQGRATDAPGVDDGAAAVPEPAPKRPVEKRPAEPAAPAEESFPYEFYDLLPDQKVVVPPRADDKRPVPPPTVERAPGVYVIQAGAFPDFAQADAVKARLALLGIVAQIQQITVDGRTFHRVRVGPIEDAARLKRMRDQLRANRIDHIVVPVTE